MSVEDAIRKFLSAVREGIRIQQRERGLLASGKSSDSLQIVSTPTDGKLTGDASFYYQIHGRGPGEMPPVRSMQDWIKIKGLDLNPWAVAKKIANEGTAIYRGERKGLEILPILMEHKPEFMQDVGKAVAERIMKTAFKK